MAFFSIAGEGILDLSVARVIIYHHGHQVFAEFDKRGKDRLDASLHGYFLASRHSPWLILRDLDAAECPITLLDNIAPNRADFGNALLRVCIRSVESWLLADRTGFSQHFGVSANHIPAAPDNLLNPKLSLVQCVARSRFRNLREGIVPRTGSGRSVGPEYNAILSQYIATNWDVKRACLNSDSLNRAFERIANF
jgi:hypothetical protein